MREILQPKNVMQEFLDNYARPDIEIVGNTVKVLLDGLMTDQETVTRTLAPFDHLVDVFRPGLRSAASGTPPGCILQPVSKSGTPDVEGGRGGKKRA